MAQLDVAMLDRQLMDLRRRAGGRFQWQKPKRQGKSLFVRFSVDLKVLTAVGQRGPRFSERSTYTFRVTHRFPERGPEFHVDRGTDVPFHPFFSRDGTWADDHLPTRPTDLSGWVAAFVRSLSFDFDVTVLDRAHILNWKAAEWLRGLGEHRHEWLPSEPLDFLQGLESPGAEWVPPRGPGNPQSPRIVIHDEPGGAGRKKFQLGPMTRPYEPRQRPMPSDFCLEAGIRARPRAPSRHSVTVMPTAARKLFDHIGWGNHGIQGNRVEQGGIMLGHVYRDGERRMTYGLVEDIVPGTAARGSSTYLELGTDAWKKMLDYVDSLLDGSEEAVQIIGWYHTHPNNLDVFMSGTDRSTQSRFFSEDWHFALVLNPHRQILGAYHGADAAECHGNLLTEPWTPRQVARSPLHPVPPPVPPGAGVSMTGTAIGRSPLRMGPLPPAYADGPGGVAESPFGDAHEPDAHEPVDEPTADAAGPWWVEGRRRWSAVVWGLLVTAPLAWLGFFFVGSGDGQTGRVFGGGHEEAAKPQFLLELGPHSRRDAASEPTGVGERFAVSVPAPLFEHSAAADSMLEIRQGYLLEHLSPVPQDGRIHVRVVLEGWLDAEVSRHYVAQMESDDDSVP